MGIEKIIWQPSFCQGKNDFKISLDLNFARKMITAPIPIKNQENLNRMVNERLEEWKLACMDPYHFYKDTAFVDEIHIGGNGRWLATDHPSKQSLLRKDKYQERFEYYSHNIDTSFDAIALLSLFDIWVQYSEILKGK